MIAYIDNGGRIPKALISDNDIIAAGALSALNEKGYDIPNDVSIVGFDDMPYCTMLQPKLSTIAVNNYRMGVLAVRRLVDHIESQNDEVVKILLETNLIKRQSVKDLK
jgi:LacI family transcriptional regulator